MKHFFVVGNPIDHSLSPKLHNFWIRENNIKAVYNKKLLQENEVEELISEMRNNRINGINITVPFKKSIIPFLDELTPLAKKAQSVNTIFKSNNRIMGDNTDIGGFESSLKHINYNVKNKKIFILGAGGVVTSIILALTNLGASQISLSNRTIEKAEIIKKNFPSLKIVEWGKYNDFDIIINATSVGLKKEDQIKLDLSKIEPNKLFYDVIYNPSKTNFLLQGEKLGHKTENGKMMFIYQAQLAFKIWHNILPKIKNNLLD